MKTRSFHQTFQSLSQLTSAEGTCFHNMKRHCFKKECILVAHNPAEKIWFMEGLLRADLTWAKNKNKLESYFTSYDGVSF